MKRWYRASTAEEAKRLAKQEYIVLFVEKLKDGVYIVHTGVKK